MTDLDHELAQLATERTRPELSGLDTRSTRDLVAAIAEDDAGVPAAVAAASDAITAAVDVVVERLERGGRLVYAGAGTPGRLGVLDAAECVPTFGTEPGQVTALLAGGVDAMTASREGAEDDPGAAAEALADIEIGADDVLVAITASGRTPYALGAAETARESGAATIGISNNAGSRLSSLVDVAIEVCTGPEIIAGSTRMKAGTAQKLVLNTLTTASMIRLGKTYDNLMVDVQATNDKLRSRAQRIVVEATGVSPDVAADTLAAAGGHVKTAIVALLAEIDVAEARNRLAACAGRVRNAVDGGSGAETPT
ncbi:N-acetylmuramic acid 6-phosphate etherase [Rhodococcus sp. WMMA185]|uniref:N-acetylmuramic acid 6-phosphate etherase n=1 Tax=Rhodococcus sp. WMMA185 TaxID=679318 RepID=UPI0008783469|nr:N-acetylmuramic acid 6-phosphate etherase [Rhodococcus sp. WMMA185]AOW93994.1 N-acetylmuramic acid 6-phosphate etherase [Rhodococcus sp. WMMA185]